LEYEMEQEVLTLRSQVALPSLILDTLNLSLSCLSLLCIFNSLQMDWMM
jgi:hypothetical protein